MSFFVLFILLVSQFNIKKPMNTLRLFQVIRMGLDWALLKALLMRCGIWCFGWCFPNIAHSVKAFCNTSFTDTGFGDKGAFDFSQSAVGTCSKCGRIYGASYNKNCEYPKLITSINILPGRSSASCTSLGGNFLRWLDHLEGINQKEMTSTYKKHWISDITITTQIIHNINWCLTHIYPQYLNQP